MSGCEETDGGGKVRSMVSTAGGKAVKDEPQPGSDPVVVLRIECPKTMPLGSLAGLQSCISGPRVSPEASNIVGYYYYYFLGGKCMLAPNCHVLSPSSQGASKPLVCYKYSN